MASSALQVSWIGRPWRPSCSPIEPRWRTWRPSCTLTSVAWWRARLDEARRQGDPFVTIEAIKLVEGGLAERCDEVWLVTCPEATQRQRLAERGMPPADVERRLATQGPDLAARLRPAAQRCLETTGTKAEVRDRVEDALADLLAPRFAGLPWGPVERP